jgi:VIT family protein
LTASGLDSWYHEKESAWLYRRVAAAEPDPRKSELFVKLAAAAEEQAVKWQLAARRGPGAHSSERGGAPDADLARGSGGAPSQRPRRQSAGRRVRGERRAGVEREPAARYRGRRAIATVAGVTLTALFAVGVGLSLFTGRHALRGALRMVLIGGGAGAVSFFVGRALGVAIG